MKAKNKRRIGWAHYVASMTPFRCAELIKKNEPLRITMGNVFFKLLKNLLMLYNRIEGIHFFINHNRELDEIHYIRHSRSHEHNNSISLNYTIVNGSNLQQWLEDKHLLRLQENDSAPLIKFLEKELLQELLSEMRISGTKNSDQGLIIPFDYDKINLGRFIIWNERKSRFQRKEIPYNTMLGWIATWYRFLAKLFSREYGVEENTYLPSYYSVGWKKVAILFADIRNFTTMTEMLRNAYSFKGKDHGPLREIVNEYCSEMSIIIQDKYRGRIDKFMGDGILALFGEYDNHPSYIVCKAVHVACKMIERFRSLKSKWEEMAFGKGYDLEFNETVEIDLGIGIDFGSVLFEYLGDDRHREYGVIGDHVNFAQRLEGVAAKEDEKTKEKRPPIILSRTALRCCKPWLTDYREVEIFAKGKGHKYKCYGIEPNNFNESFFISTEENGNWNTAWTKTKEGPPSIF
jgi:class 3 adenylate cyclase